jgi:hypothetical protein
MVLNAYDSITATSTVTMEKPIVLYTYINDDDDDDNGRH